MFSTGLCQAVQSAVITFEEVGTIEFGEVVYFSEIGPFQFTGRVQGTQVDGIRVYEFLDRSIVYSPVNAAEISSSSHPDTFRDSWTQVSMINGGIFNFDGAYFASKSIDNPRIQINGYFEGELLYTHTVNRQSGVYIPTWSGANMQSIDRLTISAGAIGSGTITMDDFTYSVTSVPIPAAAWLFSAGLLSLAGLARRDTNA